MIRSLSRYAAVTGLALGFLALVGSSSAQQPPPKPTLVTVSTRWTGDTPRSVTVQTSDLNKGLALDTANGQFKGDIPVGRSISDADLLVDYADNTEVSLPLRLSAGTPSIALAVNRPSGVRCTRQQLTQLGTPTAALSDAVHNYLAAKAINQITGDDQCGRLLRPAAAKAWFDTSYALVKMRPFFRLDPGARAAYAQVDPKQAAIYQRQADAAHVAAIYNQTLTLFKAGQADDALALNGQLAATLREDGDLAKAAKQLQGVTEGRLVSDSVVFEAAAKPPEL